MSLASGCRNWRTWCHINYLIEGIGSVCRWRVFVSVLIVLCFWLVTKQSQAVILLLAFASTVFLGFGPYSLALSCFSSFRDQLYVLKWVPPFLLEAGSDCCCRICETLDMNNLYILICRSGARQPLHKQIRTHQLHCNRGTVLPVQSVTKCYNQGQISGQRWCSGVEGVAWWVSERVSELLRSSPCELLLWEAGNWAWDQFWNSEEGVRPPLEAVTWKLMMTQQAEKI
jgi:hypothetical protein